MSHSPISNDANATTATVTKMTRAISMIASIPVSHPRLLEVGTELSAIKSV